MGLCPCARAGLEVSVDLAGNLIGRCAGSEPDRPPLLLGSHIDPVSSGGNYDGQVGSMAALEVAATLSDPNHRTCHDLESVIWANEEGGKTGSRTVAGELEPAELDIRTATGFTIGEGTRRIGGDLSRPEGARRDLGSLAAYLELHIEQGFVLDRSGIDIGLVEGIVGIKRWNVTVEGFANHAGTHAHGTAAGRHGLGGTDHPGRVPDRAHHAWAPGGHGRAAERRARRGERHSGTREVQPRDPGPGDGQDRPRLLGDPGPRRRRWPRTTARPWRSSTSIRAGGPLRRRLSGT